MYNLYLIHKTLFYYNRTNSSLVPRGYVHLFPKGFLCNDDCALFHNIQGAITYLLLSIGNKNDIQNTLIKVLEQVPEKWAIYLSHSQIWNQNRPLWIRMVLSIIQPTIKYIMKIVAEDFANSFPEEILNIYFDNLKSTLNCLPEGTILLTSLVENILPPDVIPLGDSVLIQLLAMCMYDEFGNESCISEALCRFESNIFPELRNDIEEITHNLTKNLSYLGSDEVTEILIHQILAEKSGRASLKMVYKYLKADADWLQIKLKIKLDNDIKLGLLHKMFYIGDSEYDQVLSGTWIPKWASFINLPLGITCDIIQDQLSMRSEFGENAKLTKHDQFIVNQLKSQFLPVINCTV